MFDLIKGKCLLPQGERRLVRIDRILDDFSISVTSEAGPVFAEGLRHVSGSVKKLREELMDLKVKTPDKLHTDPF
eukprot:scaffold122496_cov19-Prasinocladus_malaysianus.AAC.2